MKTMKLLACMLLAICVCSCATEGKPSEIGEILTPEQVAGLAGDDSWNGKLVAVHGYPKFARKLIKIGNRNFLSILNQDGEQLIQMNILVADPEKEGTVLAGTKPRNLIYITPSDLDIQSARFIADDYSKFDYGEFLFSGTLVYDGENCYLNDVTIHNAQ